MTAMTESGGRDFLPSGAPVTSPKGARYAMQVMPNTAHNPGFGITPVQNESAAEYDRVGNAYLKMLYQRYNGDPSKMWAAYNAGPGRVDSALQTHGADWFSAMPGETQDYVKKNMQDFNNLQVGQ